MVESDLLALVLVTSSSPVEKSVACIVASALYLSSNDGSLSASIIILDLCSGLYRPAIICDSTISSLYETRRSMSTSFAHPLEHLYVPCTANSHKFALAFKRGTNLWNDSPCSCLISWNLTRCTTLSTVNTAALLISVSRSASLIVSRVFLPTISSSLALNVESQLYSSSLRILSLSAAMPAAFLYRSHSNSNVTHSTR